MRTTLLLCLALLSCDKPAPPPTAAELLKAAEQDRALEAATPCTETYHATADAFSGQCRRSDQTLTFEKDADGDAYAVCRCRSALAAGGGKP